MDIFDTVTVEKPKKDIFDTLGTKGDIFDKISTPSFFQKAKETVSTFAGDVGEGYKQILGTQPEPVPAEIPAIQKMKGESTLGLIHPEQRKAGQILRREKEYKGQIATVQEAMAKQPEFYQDMTPEDVIKREELHKEGMGEVTQPAVDPIDFASFIFGGGLPSLAKTALKGVTRQTISKTIELGLKSSAIGLAQIPIGQTTDVLSETRLGKQYPEAVVAFNFIANAATIYGINKAVNDLANSNLWRRMTIKERGLVLQSVEDLKVNGMSEGKIARYYPKYKEELIKERMPTEPEPTPIPEPGVPIVKVKEALPEGKAEYLYHNSSQRFFEDIKESGLTLPEEGNYPHGIKEIADNIPRIYFAKDIKRALEFGGVETSKYPELKSLLLRIKKSAIEGKLYESKTLSGGETWLFEKGVDPKFIEYYDKGNDVWKPITGKLAKEAKVAEPKSGDITKEGEPVTTNEIKETLKEAGAETISPKEQKQYLIDEINTAITDAPELYDIPELEGTRTWKYLSEHDKAKIDKVKIEVPGDGIFEVYNTKDRLEHFKKLVKSNFPEKEGYRTKTLYDKREILSKREREEILKEAKVKPTEKDIFDVIEGKATPSGLADVGGYARGEASPSIIDMPEITELAKELMAGKYPKISQKLRAAAGQALGQFRPKGVGEIKLRADIFKDPELAKKVFAHEIGHLADYLPEGTMARGNILGRIASLKRYMSSLLEESRTGIVEPFEPVWKKLTPEDRAKIRAEATRQSKLAGGRIRANVSPDVILDIWRKTEGWDKELYDYVAKLSNFDKKHLMQKALAGVIPDWFKFKFSEAPEDVQVLYKKLLEDEIIRRGLFRRDTIMNELKAVTQIWKPFNDKANPAFTKYRYSPKELYADAFSVLLNNPSLLQDKAPEFYKAFFNWMEAKPEVMSLYESIQDRLTRPEEVMQKRDYNIEQMYLRGEEKQFQAQEKQAMNIGDILTSLKTELIDANARLIKKVKGVEKQGVKIVPEDNPRYWVEELPYTSSEVLNMLRDINTVKSSLNGNGISDVDIGKYMMLKRVSTERAEMANPLGHTKETAIAHLEFMKKKLGAEKFQQLEEGVQQFRELRQKNVISVIEKTKMLDPETIELIKNAENYATFDVQAYIEKRYGRLIGSRIYKQIGTLNEITNPFTATVMKDAAMLRAANRKMTADVTVKFLQDFYPGEITPSETRWNGKYHEPIDSKDPSKGSITFLHEGKVQSYDIDKYIAKSFNSDPYEASIILKAFQVVSRPIKEILVSKNPAFIMWNIQRDIRSFAKQVPGASLLDAVKYAIKSVPDAYKDVFKNISTADVAEMYKNRELIVGRIYGGEHLTETKQLDRLLNSYGENPVMYRNKILAPFQRLWDWLDKPGQMAERITKIAGHKFLNDFSKLSEKEKAHIIRTRAGSPDFKRVGGLVALYNNLFLFSNAGKEGIRASVEAFKENPSAYAWKTMKYDIIPKLLMYGAGIGLFGATVQKLFNNIPDNDKTNYMTIPLGETKEGKTVFFVMPHDFQGQLIAGVMWRMLNTRKLDDIQQLADYTAGGLPYQGLHPVIGATIEAAQYTTGKNPYDSFRGKYVIPEQRFTAGGWQAHQIFLKHIANNLGMASLIYRFPTDDLDRIKGTLEKSKDIPVAGRLIDRFVRVSNRGQAEQYREVSKEVRQRRAEENINIQDAIIDSISSGKALNRNQVKGLYEQLKNKGNIKTTKFEDFLETYKKFAVKRHDMPFITAYMSAGSNEEKAAIIQKYMEITK